MNPSTGKHSAGSRPFLKGGIAVVAVGLVANGVLIMNRGPTPQPAPAAIDDESRRLVRAVLQRGY